MGFGYINISKFPFVTYENHNVIKHMLVNCRIFLYNREICVSWSNCIKLLFTLFLMCIKLYLYSAFSVGNRVEDLLQEVGSSSPVQVACKNRRYWREIWMWGEGSEVVVVTLTQWWPWKGWGKWSTWCILGQFLGTLLIQL